jgi:hypothetical protein
MAKTKKRPSSATVRREQVQQQRSETAKTNARNRNRRKVASRRNPLFLVGGIVVALVIIIGVFVYLAHQGSASSGQTSTHTDSTTFKAVTSVDPTLLSQIGTGGVANPFTTPSGSPPALTGPTGKPEVFYYGGEFCPYCAAQRWSVIVAMSRFGTFSTLNETTSSSTDVYPDTHTFTFYKSSYTSSYVDFVPVEGEDRNQQPLQTLTTDQQTLVSTYDSASSIPFMDIGNKYLVPNPVFSPALLRSNTQDPNSQPLTQSQIAGQLSTNNSLSQQILGGANYFTAAICSLTNNQPSSVCGDTAIQSIEKSLSQTKTSLVPTSGNAMSASTTLPEADVRRML